MKKPTQSDLIMECFRYHRGQWVSAYSMEEWLRARGKRCKQLPARIFYLKRDGHKIEGRFIKGNGREYSYRLIEGAA